MTGLERWRWGARIVLALFYAFAGYKHLESPAGFVQITPGWVPFPQQAVLFTGLAEIAGAIGLLIPHLRKVAGIGLALYAVCVFPANINHAFNDIAIGGVDLDWSYHGPRLAFQPIFVWWALWVGIVIEWPFRRRN